MSTRLASFGDGAILLAGGTGFLGGLAATAVLRHTRARLVLAVRPRHDPAQVLARIGRLLLSEEVPEADIEPLLERVRVLPLPADDEVVATADALRTLGVREVMHCAGSVAYFDRQALDEANVELTGRLLRLAASLEVDRFTYLSTAFACGFAEGNVAETPHPEPASDPTDYTRSKRQAERIVLASGIPALIVRPSVVIGSSRTGRYDGPPYGLYQVWEAFARFLCDVRRTRLHLLVGASRMHFLHQDHFQDALVACLRHLPAGIVHVVAGEDGLPRIRDLYDLWHQRVFDGAHLETIWYERLADMPLEQLSRRERLFLEFTGVNQEIANAPWRFLRPTLEGLHRRGLLAELPTVTLTGLGRCQDRFVAGSHHVRRYRESLGLADPASASATA